MTRPIAYEFFQLGSFLQLLAETIKNDARTGDTPNPCSVTTAMIQHATRNLREKCDRLSLTFTLAEVDRFFHLQSSPTTLKKLHDGLEAIESRLRDELENHHFIHLPGERKKQYQNRRPLGTTVHKAFPDITRDAVEASKCVAVGRYTAAVFHLVRVLEFGLDSFLSRLSVTPGPMNMWGDKIREVKKAVDALPKNSAGEVEYKRKCQALYESYVAIKDGWRNPAAHDLGKVYTEEEAEELFKRTRRVLANVLAL